MSFEFRSVAQKFLVPTITVFLVILSTLGAFTIYKNLKMQQAMFSAKGLATASFVAKISVQYVINFDLTALESFTAELGKDKDVVFAGFYDDKGKGLVKFGKEPDSAGMMIFEQNLVDVGNKQYGKFTLAYSKAAFEEATRQAAIADGIEVLIEVLIAAALMIVTTIFIAKGVTKPINRAVQIAGRIATGDLSERIDVNSQDETGQLLHSLQEMNANLCTLVGDIRSNAALILAESEQIGTGNSNLAQRTEQAASSLVHTAASMAQLTETVKQNAHNATEANQLAVGASEVAGKGGEVVEQVVMTMGSINESSRKIADIISVIDGIAFQTNILALNAAVEAARAGEQGRGFAVVASEVRSLAQRSATAAKEIKALIDDSVDKVRNGNRLVEQAGITMKDVVTAIRQVTDIMTSISDSSNAQITGIEEVNADLLQMEDATRQNGAMVKEAKTASQALSKQAAYLMKAVSAFKLSDAQNSMAASAARVAKPPSRKAAPPPAKIAKARKATEEF